MGGSLGEAHADSIVRVLRARRHAGVPVVGFVESGRRAAAGGPRGARRLRAHLPRQRRAVARACRRSRSSAGSSAGGGAYSPALTDFVVMTESARMFLTGPKSRARRRSGEQVSMEDLGGPGVHARNGVCQLVAADDAPPRAWPATCSAPAAVAVGEQPPIAPLAEAGDPEPGAPVPAERAQGLRRPRRRRAIADDGRLLELSAALGAQHGHRARPHRGPPGRR